MPDARVAFYGDDVTGSVDVLLQFARQGRNGRLFVGLPAAVSLAEAAAQCEVVGIAGIARSLPTANLDAEVRPALEALAALDPDVVQYKACSTADSSPSIGSLGRVLEIGREVFGVRPVPMLFAQPDFGRYTVFGHHFAAEGGVVHRLDRQPTMSTHPSTPMGESHLATHLSRQTDLPIGTLPITAYSTPAEIAEALRTSADAGVVLDAIDDAHLALLGRSLRELIADHRPVFAIGSGGLSRAIALGENPEKERPSTHVPHRGPVLVVSGSRSPQTRRQADAAERAGWLVRPLVLDGGMPDQAQEAIAALRAGRGVVLTSDDTALPQGSGSTALAAIADAAASVVLDAVRAGATARVVVCGGDTSGRVVRRLGIDSLSIATNPEGNVVLLRSHALEPAIDGLELLLKGGQVGGDDLFLTLADTRRA